MSKQKFSIKLVILAVSLVMTLFLPLSAFAQSGAQVSLKQVESTGKNLKVDVVAENVADLYGMEFQIKYDPSVLAVKDAAADQDGVQVAPGEFLPVSQGFVVANKAADGTITLAVTLLNPAPAVNGSGVLAHLAFDVLNDNTTNLEITQLNLVSSNMNPIPNQVKGLTIGSQSSGSMLWILVGGGVVGLILIVAIGGFMMMGSAKPKAQLRPETTHSKPTPTVTKVSA